MFLNVLFKALKADPSLKRVMVRTGFHAFLQFISLTVHQYFGLFRHLSSGSYKFVSTNALTLLVPCYILYQR